MNSRLKDAIPDVSCKYGAPMGRQPIIPIGDDAIQGRVHLCHVPFVDGDYDQGGAYWGGPSDLYCALAATANEVMGLRVFVRAASREGAKAELRDQFPELTLYFYR